MSCDFNTLYGKFATMFSHVWEVIRENALPLENLKSFLELFRTLEADLAEINTLQGVMHLIRKNCSLVDISILEAVVEHFEISEAQKYIDDYKIVIDDSCRKFSIALCLNEPFDVVKTRPLLKCEAATFVFDWEPDDEHKLKDVKDILSKTAGKQVKIRFIKKGNSIIVTCSFPYFLTGSLIKKVTENLNVLKEKRLIKLTIGYYTVWNKQVCFYIVSTDMLI